MDGDPELVKDMKAAGWASCTKADHWEPETCEPEAEEAAEEAEEEVTGRTLAALTSHALIWGKACIHGSNRPISIYRHPKMPIGAETLPCAEPIFGVLYTDPMGILGRR